MLLDLRLLLGAPPPSSSLRSRSNSDDFLRAAPSMSLMREMELVAALWVNGELSDEEYLTYLMIARTL